MRIFINKKFDGTIFKIIEKRKFFIDFYPLNKVCFLLKKLYLIGLVLIAGILVSCEFPDTNQSWHVQYEIAGSASTADVTFSLPGEIGIEQRTVVLPYTSQIYAFKGADHAFILAQNKGKNGSVIITIIGNGLPIKKTSSEGAYAIASASWLVGSNN